MSRPVITLTSDFGQGVFVGVMKGVILNICPQARLIDLTHDLPAQAVRAGALTLLQAAPFFPQGTVHLAVVDPGVGTSRRAICMHSRGSCFVGPDNGLFSLIMQQDPDAAAYEIINPDFRLEPVSSTFHGRDVFAPAAAHLAAGARPGMLGPALPDPIMLTWPRPKVANDELCGQVLLADRFGNLACNIIQKELRVFLQDRPARVRLGDLVIKGISRTYGQAAPGEPVALVNSWGRLELALNQGNLCAHLGINPQNAYGMGIKIGLIR
jgi:S-adenosylmethionine hydrolase